MSAASLLQSLFNSRCSDRRKYQSRQATAVLVESLESRKLLTLIGINATVNNTLESTIQTGGQEIQSGAPATTAVTATDSEFASYANLYDIDITVNQIRMTFNLADGASDPSGVVEDGTYYRYYFQFDIASNESISAASALPNATLIPNVRVMNRDTVIVEVGPGMEIGTGFDAAIDVQLSRTGNMITGRKWHDANQDGVRDSNEAWLNGWDVELIDINQNMTVAATTTTRDIDLNGDGTIDPATEKGIYEFADVPASTYVVREVVQGGWQPSFPISASSQSAYDLDQAHNLRQPTSEFLNWGGRQEKWLYGTGSWYFITPDGNFYSWNGSPQSDLTGTLLARLSPSYYEDLSKLYSAASPRQPLIDVDGTVPETFRSQDFGNYIESPEFSVALNDNNTATFSWNGASNLTYEVWITDIAAKARQEVTNGISGSTFVSGLLPDRSYRVWMRAKSDSGEYSNWTASQEFEFFREAVANPVASGLDAGIDATPTLTIHPQAEAVSYDVQITNDQGRVIYEATGSANHRVTKSLRHGSYAVAVRARYADGSRTLLSDPQTLTVGGQPVVTGNGGQFMWAPVKAATHYTVWVNRVDVDGQVLENKVQYLTDLRETTYAPENLSVGYYSLWVQAVRSEANQQHRSIWSTQVDFRVPFVAPINSTQSPAGSSAIGALVAIDEYFPAATIRTIDSSVTDIIMVETTTSDMLDQSEE